MKNPLIFFLLVLSLAALACNLTTQAKQNLPTEAPPAQTPTPLPQPVQPQPVTPASNHGAGTCENRLGEIKDVTVRDDTQMQPGETFIKTWALENKGTCVWTPGYSLAFAAGYQMGGVSPIPLGATVSPGESAEVSVQLTAPQVNGKYRGLWMLQDEAGKRFGHGAVSDQPFWVQIIVSAEGAPAANNATAALKLDVPYYSGACPASLTFYGAITLNTPADARFQMEMGSDDPNTTLNPPDAQSHTFTAGETLTVNYPVLISHTMQGWARLHVTSPVEVVSEKVAFSVTCK